MAGGEDRHDQNAPSITRTYPCVVPLRGFEFGLRHPALSDDGPQRSSPEFGVIRNRDRPRTAIQRQLHHNVTTALADFDKAMALENGTHILA